ncbi:MAG: hypothetical protein GY729_10880 [Desulfobacteraceae bacterium]|nr:hypothetical protein [Desulfobacteraceae bacterium]
MPNILSNKKNVISLILYCFLVLPILVFASVTNAETQITIGYSPGIDDALPKVKTALRELQYIEEKCQCKSKIVIFKPSPIEVKLAKPKMDGQKIDIMVVMSSEVEAYSKAYFWGIENRVRESVLVSFLAVSAKDAHGPKPLAQITANDTKPLIYPKDTSSNNFLNDFVIKCIQDTETYKLVVKSSDEAGTMITPTQINLSGVLVKLVHFENRLVGINLFNELNQTRKSLMGIPLVDPEKNEKLNHCASSLTSPLWDKSLDYRIMFTNQAQNPESRHEMLRDYQRIKGWNLQNFDQMHFIEKTEHVVLLIRGSKQDANRRAKEFNRCLFDRYWNLKSDYTGLTERAKDTSSEQVIEQAQAAKEKLTDYLKGLYLLTTDIAPIASYARFFLLPDRNLYYSKIGNKYRRQILTERLGKDRSPLDQPQLAALETSINKYAQYINFRQDATKAGHYDTRFLRAMNRYAKLKKIKFEHYLLKADTNAGSYLEDAVNTLKNLKIINDKISTDPKHKKFREEYFIGFDEFSVQIQKDLNSWERQL